MSSGGVTLHAFSGIGRGDTKAEVMRTWRVQHLWRELEILIIDEISMLRGQLFQMLNVVVLVI
jgi:ATP-dependent DNA helicase PIF1